MVRNREQWQCLNCGQTQTVESARVKINDLPAALQHKPKGDQPFAVTREELIAMMEALPKNAVCLHDPAKHPRDPWSAWTQRHPLLFVLLCTFGWVSLYAAFIIGIMYLRGTLFPGV